MKSRFARFVTFEVRDGLDKRYSVAGDVSHSYRGLVGCFSEKAEKELGILAIPRK
jgi:hypothetical protein